MGDVSRVNGYGGGMSRRALATEALSLMVMSFGGMLVGLVASILITRALGPEARGVYAWVLTVYGIATQLAMLVPYNTMRQLGSANVKEIRGGEGPIEKNWPRLAGTWAVLVVVGWVISLPVLAWALTQPLGQTYGYLLWLVWAGMPAINLATGLNALVHLRRRTSDILVPTFLSRGIVTLQIVVAWAIGILTLPLAMAATPYLAVIVCLVIVGWLGIPVRRWQFDAALARRASRFIGATWVAALVTYMAPKVVMLVLPQYAGLAELGYYSIAATLLDVALMVPNAVTSVLISHFTRMESSPRARLHTLLGLLVIVLGCAVFGVVTAPYLLPLVFGAGFIASVEPFRILLVALILQAPLAVYTGHLTARAHAWGLLLPPLASLLATTGAAFMLIPVYGMNGAAWAAVAGYAAQLLTTLPFCFKSRAK